MCSSDLGRNTQGVTLFDVADDEHVVAVARLAGAAEPADAEPEPDEPEEPGVTDSGDGRRPDGPDQA